MAKQVEQDGPRRLFSVGREKFYLCFFIFWIVMDIVELGLVSEQITKHGKVTADWPGKEFNHAIGLLLFTTIVGLVFGIFHYSLNLKINMLLFLMFGVFWGVGAGIIEESPMGKMERCYKRVPDDYFTPSWARFRDDCHKFIAIEAFAWTMFALSIIGLVYTFADTFEVTTKRTLIYETLSEKNIRKEEAKEEKRKAAKSQV